ncbi:shikimate dehydrogenase [Hippea jasoniae]|uniref:shikimate dehydrogenase n=1 Tax=Hippea jasoniae TaxID=944479 RepID=UPI000553F2C4|nr:shikimate dehydrogenase [Hippea jasoniae]
MYITANTDIFCIFGNPVKHSLSPILHNFMFEYYGIDAVYVAFEVEDIKKALESVKALSIKGCNITLPFKEDAFRYVDEIGDDDTAFLESVNTVKNENGRLIGYNTDYLGFIDLFDEYAKFCSDSDTVVVLGAGGTAVSVLYGLYKLGIENIFLLNRTLQKAERLKEKFAGKLNIKVGLLDDAIIKEADVLINTTSVGIDKESLPIKPAILKKDAIVVDVIYFDTPLVKEASKLGLAAINGMGMFVSQAFYAFKIWHGVEFDKIAAENLLKDIEL